MTVTTPRNVPTVQSSRAFADVPSRWQQVLPRPSMQAASRRRPLAGRRAAPLQVQVQPQPQPQKGSANSRRWRGKAERDAAADAENLDPAEKLRLNEDWGIDSPDAGFEFAEKGTRLAPGGGGRWQLLEPEPESPPPQAQEAAHLRHVVPQRDEMLRRRRLRLGGGDSAADDLHRSEQPVMKAKHTLSALAREGRQFQALSSSLNQMKSGGRPSIDSMAEAWQRARQPDRSVSGGGLGRGRSAGRRASVMKMGPTDASWRRCGGGAGRAKPHRLRPLSQPEDPDDAAARAASRKARVHARSRSAPMLPEGDDDLGEQYPRRARASDELRAL